MPKIRKNAFKEIEKLRVLMSIVIGRLRAQILRLRGAEVGEKVCLGRGIRIEKPWCIRLGSRVKAEDYVYLKMVDDDALLDVGNHVFLGRGTEFDIIGKVKIGEHTVIAPRCFITDHNHVISAALRIDQQPCIVEPVVIGKDVWLGTNVVILAGVKIGNGAVVGAKCCCHKGC